MLNSAIVRVVGLCVMRPWWTIAVALALAAASSVYAVNHFAIKTDINDLISPDLPWAQRALHYKKDFPDWKIIVVVDAPTPENAERATAKLADALRKRPDRFRTVGEPASGEFFARNALLFLPTADVERLADELTRADPLIGTLASDPSLRGTLDALSLALMGVERGDIALDDLVRPMTMAADTVESVLAGRAASFSWRVLASGKPAEPRDLRRFIEVEPVLDFSALQPGRRATDTIAEIAAAEHLDRDFQARVRQTGQVPIDDDEFGTLKQNAALNATLTILAVLLILWLALHSFRIIFAVVVNLIVGLAVSAAVGLFTVGALNLISVAFFVLFVGLGVDFGIQFSVRYRAERHDLPDLVAALQSAAKKAGAPLALAAVATAVGFSSFLPTPYRGLSELGEIAGSGMIIAFLTSITLLPALLTGLNPPGEPHTMGFAALAPVDRFLERHRVAVVAGVVAVVAFASPLLIYLPFDFNPLHLRSPKVESVATFLELRRDPQTGASALDIVEPNLAAADATAQRLRAQPEVAKTMTLSDLVPADQDEKLEHISDALTAIDPSLNPDATEPPPSDEEKVESLSVTAD